jgi:hypothetical protein
MRRVLAVPAVLACLLLVPAAPADASGRDVVRDCTDNGKIDSYHSSQDYKSALGHLPSDVAEYTDCRQIIEAAQRRDAHRSPPSSGGGTGGGSFPGGGGIVSTPGTSTLPRNPAEAAALAQAAGGGAPVTVAGEPITPGGSGVVSAAVRHALPAPLIVLLVLLAIGGLAWVATVARARGLEPPTPILRALDRVFPRRA